MDAIIQRLQNMGIFNIHSVEIDGTTAPWYDVTGEIVRDLVIQESDLATQVETISAQIAHWGRMAAQCKRVWEIKERELRVWKNQQILSKLTPPKDDKGWKKPTQQLLEASYRADPVYSQLHVEVERAEEAYNAAQAIQDGFRAKRDMLRAAVVKYRDDAAPRLSV